MRVAFFGTPQLAARYLETLATKHEVVGVVTQCDRPRGRKGTPQPPPVKQVGERLDAPVFQPQRGECDAACRALHDLKPDVCVVVAFGQIIPCAPPDDAEALDYINVHYSLLPQLRGAAPVQHAILKGLEHTGVTIQHLVQELDAGDIILQETVDILPDDTTAALMDRLTALGIGALDRALELLDAGQATRKPQDHEAATWAPTIEKSDGTIDWSEPADLIERKTRAFTPWPGASTRVGGKLVKILRASAHMERSSAEGQAGAVVEIAPKRGFAVACGAGRLWVKELQPAGKRPMLSAAYINGAHLEIGSRLG